MNTLYAQKADALRERVASLLSEYHQRGYFPSAVARVFTASETLCEATIGGVSGETVFDVASLTKIATATQILLLIEEGALRLDTEILSCLPYLSKEPLLRERLAGITIQALLTHTSRIVDWYPFYVEKGNFARVLSIALERYAPVEGMVYSDLNFMLLGKVIEAIRVRPLDACLTESLVAPYALGRMTYRPDPAWDIAPSCYGNPIEETMCAERGLSFDSWRAHTPVRGQANDGNAYYFFGGVAGSAGIFSDVTAYQRLCQLYLSTDLPLLLDAQKTWADTRGLGFQTSKMYPDGCGHTGFTGTSIYIAREHGFGVVAFTNRLFYKERNENSTNDFRLALHQAAHQCLTA